MDSVQSFLPPVTGLVSAPLLPLMAAHAREADQTRTISPAVIQALKASDVMGLSATRSLGGGEAGVEAIGFELEAIAPHCTSTAWCLWNHLCVFHLYCTTFGPEGFDLLAAIVRGHEWVTYPNGAGTGVRAVEDCGEFVLDGVATFASGARYAEWALIMFSHDTGGEKPSISDTLVRLDAPGVSINATWDGMSVRASATDDVVLERVRTPASLARPFFIDLPRRWREPEYAVFHHRYREDWVGLSVLWLAAQATGVAAAALDDAVSQAAGRKAIFGVPMAQRPGVQLNLGQAAALVASARATWREGSRETDDRIARGVPPTEADHVRQHAYAMVSLRLSGQAMALLLRTLGGNGLRESGTFEGRFRDYQAMALHIIAHPDRVNEITGKFLLGIS